LFVAVAVDQFDGDHAREPGRAEPRVVVPGGQREQYFPSLALRERLDHVPRVWFGERVVHGVQVGQHGTGHPQFPGLGGPDRESRWRLGRCRCAEDDHFQVVAVEPVGELAEDAVGVGREVARLNVGGTAVGPQ
jgi:hypothetical protein